MKRLLIEKIFPQFESQLRDELNKRGILCLYKTDDVLVKMGQPLKKTFLILQGCVKAYRPNEQGSEFVITYLRDGESFAISISADSPASSKISLMTIRAIEPTYVLTLSYTDKDILAKKFSVLYKYILQTSVRYYGAYIDLITNIVFHKLDDRISYFLLQLSKATKKNILPISHQEIAMALNVSREAVSRLLKKMEEMGKIRLMHNEIEIIDLQVL
jgi:CRP/FNR family transcriptional regulator, anaerobic regulatory protein